MNTYTRNLILLFLLASVAARAQYKEIKPVEPTSGEVPVTQAGVYAESGKTYRLLNDITSTGSTIFLGKDVTLDLNGHTIRYADAPYEHIPNSGFEEGTKGWDLSAAPGAKVENTEEVHVYVGKKLMSLKAGDEIVSPYINLPVDNRSYFAMCGITGHFYEDMKGDLANQMKVSVFVEDESGNSVVCTTRYGDTTMVSCPVEKRSPRLGGGVVYAHLNRLPAGRYRVRVRADTDCLVDEIDIRPAMDVGIGIVEKTYPFGHYDHLSSTKGHGSAFFDFTKSPQDSVPVDWIPRVAGSGTVTIRNGKIENAALGVLSFGVQSTAGNVKVILENVKITTTGINTIAVDVPHALITRSTFDVKSPFIINRHGSSYYGVDLRGPMPSEVSYSEFYGGQGCLVFKGKGTSVHHNKFVNRQMVTNHYSIMAMGDSSWIFDNYIEPETGSGIEIYRHRYIDIFNNTIKIKTSPPTCEYGHAEYSTSAVRMADYLSPAGAPNGTFGNRVYNNKIWVTASDFPQYPFYTPMAFGVFYSASAGDNPVFGNEIIVQHNDPGSKARAAALYICGGTNGYGGQFYGNRITTNVPAAWVATMYGGTARTRMFNNTFIKSSDAPADFKAVKVGYVACDHCIAQDVEFRSNVVEGGAFDLEVTDQHHSFSVYSTVDIQVTDKKGNPASGLRVSVLDRNQKEILSGVTDENGVFSGELLEFSQAGTTSKTESPYTVVAGKSKKEVQLKGNTQVTIVTR